MQNPETVRVGDKLILHKNIVPVPDRIRPYLGKAVTVSEIVNDPPLGFCFRLEEMGEEMHLFHNACFDSVDAAEPESSPSLSEIYKFLGL